MRKSLVPIFLLLSFVVSMAATAERPMLIRATPDNKAEMEFIRQGDFDIAYVSAGYIEIVADDFDLEKLLDAGINTEIVHEDLIAFYQSRFPLSTTMGGFPTLDEAIAFMDSLRQSYPTLVTERQSIGQSLEGRDIWMIKISDNPGQDEDEPEYFINSLTHAREPMGLEASLRFMAHLCENYGSDPQITELVDNREFYFVPVVNPDGYEYNRQTDPNGGGMWRKNRRDNGDWSYGVDLNRNWGYQWGYDDDGSSPDTDSEVYRGTEPFSEPETQVIREFIISRDFSIILNIHAYGNIFLYPWGYYNGYTGDNQLFRAIAAEACIDNGWEYGTPWELLYNTNGDATDWQYGEQEEKPKILCFVPEIGTGWDGFWPDPSRIPDLWDEVLPIMMHLAVIADNPYIYAPPDAPVLNPIGDVYEDSFVVSWEFTDTLNVATAFELKELSGLERIEDDFEQESSNWEFEGFSRSGNRVHSGSFSVFSGSENNYNGFAVLNNPVTIGEDDSLKVWVWYAIEPDYDYAYIQISTDGGATFDNLPGNITTENDPHGNNRGNGITGNSGGWVEGIFPLDDYTGQSAILGMRYVTDGGWLYEGFYADDFYPVERFEQENILSSDITDTFFTVSGRGPGEYLYQVRAIDEQDQWSVFSNMEEAIVHPQTSADDNSLPQTFSLSQNYPNPFNPQTAISFSVNVRAAVELTVYNVLGMKVRGLVDSEFEAGEHSVIFDGLDDAGKQVSAGIYFYRLKTVDKSLTKRMVLIK
ncbi:MAG: M14 family zinc carboxypeptidase [candidate division Zixibacteria bacterium]